MKHIVSSEKGFVVSIITFFVLIIMLSIAVSMSAVIAQRQKISTNGVSAIQSFYAAESGAEDALLRLNGNPEMSSLSYSLPVGSATANVTIPNSVGGSRTVASQGSASTIIKNVQVVYSINSQNVNFYYGVEVGAGGLVMNGGSEIAGNVFSNGNISGSGTIDNNAIVSGNGHSLTGVYVGGDALVYSCISPASVNNLTYVTGGTHTCTVRGSSLAQAAEISAQPLPIPQTQIDTWKGEAASTCSAADVTNLGRNNKSVTMGSCKITGDLSFGNSTTLTMTGTIYVTGNISLGNTDTIKLDSSYGSLGGVIVADGTINTGNGNTFSGSGQAGSYLLFLSTSASDSAVVVSNNSAGAAFYANNGGVQIPNNVSVLEVTGYKLTMGNNAKIQSSSGVVNIFFSNGPGGGWKVTSWGEK